MTHLEQFFVDTSLSLNFPELEVQLNALLEESLPVMGKSVLSKQLVTQGLSQCFGTYRRTETLVAGFQLVTSFILSLQSHTALPCDNTSV